jgi:hypothetical protein
VCTLPNTALLVQVPVVLLFCVVWDSTATPGPVGRILATHSSTRLRRV